MIRLCHSLTQCSNSLFNSLFTSLSIYKHPALNLRHNSDGILRRIAVAVSLLTLTFFLAIDTSINFNTIYHTITISILNVNHNNVHTKKPITYFSTNRANYKQVILAITAYYYQNLMDRKSTRLN